MHGALGKPDVRQRSGRRILGVPLGIISIGNEVDVDFRRGVVCATRELAIYRRGVLSVLSVPRAGRKIDRETERKSERKRKGWGAREPIGISLMLRG